MRQANVTNHMNRHRLHKKPVITAIFALAFAIIFSAISPSQTFAVTPPDSCFNITASGYITAYYNHQGNNAANPACPKDVDIPNQIDWVTVIGISGSNAFASKQLTSVTFPNTLTYLGGLQTFKDNLLTSIIIPNSVTQFSGSDVFADNLITSVTLPNSVTIFNADNAFANNQLTSVTLPNSIESIPTNAFANNQLTSITIPSTVTSIGACAFMANKLTSVTMPSSVTSVGDRAFAFNQLTSATIEGPLSSNAFALFSNNDTDFATAMALDNSSILAGARGIYLRDTASIVPVYMPNGAGSIVSNVGYTGSSGFTIGGVSYTQTAMWGGQLINPAQLTVQYKDTNGNIVAPSITEVGDGLGDYKMSTLRALYGLYPDVPMADALTHYYLTGTTVSKTAPTITGYTLSSPATQTIELDVGANTMTFTYKANSDSDNDGAGSADDTETPAAPNTGLHTSIVSNPAITVSGLVLIGAVVIVLRRRFAR